MRYRALEAAAPLAGASCSTSCCCAGALVWVDHGGRQAVPSETPNRLVEMCWNEHAAGIVIGYKNQIFERPEFVVSWIGTKNFQPMIVVRKLAQQDDIEIDRVG